MVFPTMRVPRDRPPYAPGGDGRVLVVGSVPLIACGGSRLIIHAGAGDILKPAHARALASPLAGGLAVHPTA